MSFFPTLVKSFKLLDLGCSQKKNLLDLGKLKIFSLHKLITHSTVLLIQRAFTLGRNLIILGAFHIMLQRRQEVKGFKGVIIE